MQGYRRQLEWRILDLTVNLAVFLNQRLGSSKNYAYKDVDSWQKIQVNYFYNIVK